MKPARFMFPMFALIRINDGEYRLVNLYRTRAVAATDMRGMGGYRMPIDYEPPSYYIIEVPTGTSVDDLERTIEACARLRASGVGKVGA